MIKEAQVRCQESTASTGMPSGCSCDAGSLEDVLYELELEDMCEQDPTVWDDLANQRWQEHSQTSNGVVDSTTGESLDPTKVQAGCDEEMGFMTQMHVWDKVPRVQAQNDPDGKIVGTRWVFVKKGR